MLFAVTFLLISSQLRELRNVKTDKAVKICHWEDFKLTDSLLACYILKVAS